MQERELKAFTFACIDKAVQANIAKLSIQNGDFSLTIETQNNSVGKVETASLPAAPQPEEKPEFDGTVVPSPLVGTFYASSAPEEPPMVQAGDTVSKGDVLCIIEAMKVMNSIESPCDGVISRVLAVNGDLVEYNQPLFVIKEKV